MVVLGLSVQQITKFPETFRGGSGENRWKRNSPEPKTMKTNLLCKISSIICALMFASFSSAQAATINSTYTGPTDGNWGDPANWSPAHCAKQWRQLTRLMFRQPLPTSLGVTLDLDVTVNRLTLNPGDGIPIDTVGGSQPHFCCDSLDHNFTSAHTSVGDGGIVSRVRGRRRRHRRISASWLTFPAQLSTRGYAYIVIS